TCPLCRLSGEAGAIGGCYSLNTEYLFPYLIISAYKRQKTYPKNLPNIIGSEPTYPFFPSIQPLWCPLQGCTLCPSQGALVRWC
ncbi:MAG: hypothetical protein KIH08_07615, partial [Candidatus Freyarchaeota archaeon]|nr:hypothetical protein [Candidatus Jordarchaeia archaeon]